jgi:hypothetical protein
MRRIFWGSLAIIVGIWIWLSHFGIPFISFKRDWPVLLVIIGIWIILRRLLRKRKRTIEIIKDLEQGEINVDEAVDRLKQRREK